MATYRDRESGHRVKLVKAVPHYVTKESYVELVCQETNQPFVISQSQFDSHFTPENELSTQDKLAIYRSLFRGREDVYAKSFVTPDGGIQYYPSYTYGWKELPPDKRQTEAFTDAVLKAHLRGEVSLGLFPLTLEETCYFLVMDFDESDWQVATLAVKDLADKQGFSGHIEISRSGQGAHLWFFFEQALPAGLARRFGKQLLVLAMQERADLSFSAFDRLFPNQDFLPQGGFGNLIALPLQGQDYKRACRVFVDEKWQAYPNQWLYLQGIRKISQSAVVAFLNHDWPQAEVDSALQVVLSNELCLQKASLTPQTLYALKRLASFSNPEYYLKRRLRQPIYQVPERIYLFRETASQLYLPRGLLNDLKMSYPDLTLDDQRQSLSKIKISFTGELRFEQEAALSDLMRQDNGFLCAHTGFGKTVLAAALIARLSSPTLIVVHNKQLLAQWQERLEQFLIIDEEPVYRYTPTGRRKQIGTIGQFGAGKQWRTGLVDVAMVQSLAQLSTLEDVLDDYELLLVDECHHTTALMFERVVAAFKGTYLYGLTATPERKNGHHPILYQRLGPLLHDARERTLPFACNLHLRVTSFGQAADGLAKSSDFIGLNEALAGDESRNQLLCQDIVAAYQAGRRILVLTNRLTHIDQLAKLLTHSGLDQVFSLAGKTRERSQILAEVVDLEQPFVLLSTGKFIGEGFDLPQLDCLILAAPLSWKNNLIQYAGRLHRSYPGKTSVEIRDYIDVHVPYLERMFHRRQLAYKQLGYQLGNYQETTHLYEATTFRAALQADLLAAHTSCHVVVSQVSKAALEQWQSWTGHLVTNLYLPTSHPLLADLDRLTKGNLHLFPQKEARSTTLIVIDERLVWFGNLAVLKSERLSPHDHLLRLDSPSLAKELLGKLATDKQ